jgi:hypothetical protein
MKCQLCHKKVPKNRKKFCSYFCVKRSWYLKQKSFKHSALVEGANFNSSTQKGFFWELHAAKLLKAICVSKKIMNREWDLEKENFKIDVKSSNIYKRKLKHGKAVKNCSGVWIFNKNSENIDYFFCICLIKNKPEKYYLIPNKFFPTSGISIGGKSKYDKYLFKV